MRPLEGGEDESQRDVVRPLTRLAPGDIRPIIYSFPTARPIGIGCPPPGGVRLAPRPKSDSKTASRLAGFLERPEVDPESRHGGEAWGGSVLLVRWALDEIAAEGSATSVSQCVCDAGAGAT